MGVGQCLGNSSIELDSTLSGFKNQISYSQ
jgi:hypothetical protein